MAGLIEEPFSLWLVAPTECGFHMPSTIVCVSLMDFMPYTSTVSESGPNLNVVLGPNNGRDSPPSIW